MSGSPRSLRAVTRSSVTASSTRATAVATESTPRMFTNPYPSSRYSSPATWVNTERMPSGVESGRKKPRPHVMTQEATAVAIVRPVTACEG